MINITNTLILIATLFSGLFASDKDLIAPYFDRQHYHENYAIGYQSEKRTL